MLTQAETGSYPQLYYQQILSVDVMLLNTYNSQVGINQNIDI